jgi:hypothetical protein
MGVRITDELENIGRCPRCNGFIIAEQLEEHECDIPIKDIETIIADSCCNMGSDENGDKVTTALGIDGTYYRIIVCKHNPPHSTKRNFTGYGPNGDLTEPPRKIYIKLFYLR